MLNFLCNLNNYINYLFYSSDFITKFDKNDLVHIYKNKYERISKLTDTDILDIKTAYLVYMEFLDLISNLLDKKYVNTDRLIDFNININKLIYDKLIFNNAISLSFVEYFTYDDEEWNKIKNDILVILKDYSEYIYDDSKDEYRILTITIPIEKCIYANNMPDISECNIQTIIEFYKIINDKYYTNDTLSSYFTRDLKSFLYNSKIVKDSLHKELFESLLDTKIDIDLLYILCKEVISYISKDNLSLIENLIFKMFIGLYEKINLLDIDENYINKYVSILCALDIVVYNFAKKHNYVTDLYSTYMQIIIKLKDILENNDLNDSLYINDGIKKTYIYTYLNQICKCKDNLK